VTSEFDILDGIGDIIYSQSPPKLKLQLGDLLDDFVESLLYLIGQKQQ
jgi:hypothetical protein